MPATDSVTLSSSTAGRGGGRNDDATMTTTNNHRDEEEEEQQQEEEAQQAHLVEMLIEFADYLVLSKEQQQQQQHQPSEEAPPPPPTTTTNTNTAFQSYLEAVEAASSSPRDVMDLLASRLFVGGGGEGGREDGHQTSSSRTTTTTTTTSSSSSSSASSSSSQLITHQTSLVLLTTLATVNPPKYLKEASKSVRRYAETVPAPPYVSDDLLEVLTLQLSTSIDVEVSSNAHSALVGLCKRLPPLTERALSSIGERWMETEKNTSSNRKSRRAGGGRSDDAAVTVTDPSTISVRCATLIVDLVVLYDDAMNNTTTNATLELMERLLHMVKDTSDPLTQMSALDLVERLSTTNPMGVHRARWLVSKEVVDALLELAGGGDTADTTSGDHNGMVSEPDPLLGGPALRVLSSLLKMIGAGQHAVQFGLNEHDISTLVSGFRRALYNFDASDESGRLAFVDAVSSLASSSEDALSLVVDDPILRDGWLSLSNVAQPKLKSAILNSLAKVIDPPDEMDVNGDPITTTTTTTSSSESVMRLYRAFGIANHNRDSTAIVVSCTNAPIVETRLGGYDVIRSVMKRGGRGGVHALLNHPGFYNFLIGADGDGADGDGSSGGRRAAAVETTKVGKEAKYAILVELLRSDARPLLADEVVRTLEELVRRGPHYVKTVPWEMATE